MQRLLTILALLGVPAAVLAQDTAAIRTSGQVTTGLQQLDNTTNSSKFTEYRDLRDNLYVFDWRFSASSPAGLFLDLTGANVSRRVRAARPTHARAALMTLHAHGGLLVGTERGPCQFPAGPPDVGAAGPVAAFTVALSTHSACARDAGVWRLRIRVHHALVTCLADPRVVEEAGALEGGVQRLPIDLPWCHLRPRRRGRHRQDEDGDTAGHPATSAHQEPPRRR